MVLYEFRRAVEVTRDPRKFFKKAKSEHGNSADFKFLLVLSAVPAVIVAIASVAGALTTEMPIYGVITISVLSFFFSYMTIFLVIVIESFILHIAAHIIGGCGSLESSFKSAIYGCGIFPLTGAIPFVSVIGFYSVYLTSVGIAISHKISMKKAFVMVLLLTAAIAALELVLFGPGTIEKFGFVAIGIM